MPETNRNEKTLEDIFGPVIYSYTRQNALDDSMLIDATETAIEAGIKYPVALTDTVWKSYIEWSDNDTKRQTYQDEAGRLWDVIWMARCAIQSAQPTDSQLLFEFYCVPRGGKAKQAKCTTLKLIIGPGDNAEPVITIMLPHED